jgi:hypothetical protein
VRQLIHAIVVAITEAGYPPASTQEHVTKYRMLAGAPILTGAIVMDQLFIGNRRQAGLKGSGWDRNER